MDIFFSVMSFQRRSVLFHCELVLVGFKISVMVGFGGL